MGRERRHPQWIDSDQWADFSGSTKTTNGVDESSEETAAREAWEEMAAIVKFRNQFETVPVPGYDSLMSDLVDENFILKIEFNDFGSKYVADYYKFRAEKEGVDEQELGLQWFEDLLKVGVRTFYGINTDESGNVLTDKLRW